MKVVLDTNVLLVSIPQKSVFRPIFNSLINADFEIIVSNDILSEYAEVIERKANSIVANNIAEMLLSLQNLIKVDIYYQWNLIEIDQDDNKYVDAAISGGADYLVSNDQHFNALAKIDFPQVRVISIQEFLNLIQI